MATVRRNVVLPDALDKELDSVAEMLKETKSNLITRALSYYLDLVDLTVARERARLLDNGEKKPKSVSDLKEALGL